MTSTKVTSGWVALLVALFATGGVADAQGQVGPFSWQQPQAKVLPTGNLEWAPKAFVFEKGASARYIDFEAGDDSRDGATQQSAWKHHPWDAAATGKAKACTGIQTYVFKRGVAYRCAGPMKARESGQSGNPIRLTSDPAWGNGDAMILGSTQIKGGWKKANAAEAPGMSEPEKLWYIDLGRDYDPDRISAEQTFTAKFSSMWQVNGEKVERLHIARTPNYDLSDPNNPVKNWPVWTKYQKANGLGGGGTFTAPLLKGLGDKDLLKGAAIWTETSFLMAAVHKVSPRNYDPVAGTVQFADGGGADYSRTGAGRVHFMIENVAQFLDAPGEYFFDLNGPKPGRLYLRPPGEGEGDPNAAVYEVAQTRFPIWIQDQHDIVVSGLHFRYNDPDDGTYSYPAQIRSSACVRIIGNCSNITVSNCKFYYVADAVVAFPRPEKVEPPSGPYSVYRNEIGPFANDVMDNIIISDNDVQHAEKSHAIYLAGASAESKNSVYGKLLHVEVMRNRVVDTGFRPDAGPYSSIPAISVEDPETCEIAGNIIDTSWGNGIFTHGGKASGALNVVPLTRMLVHDNQIDNTMLGCNDYGGLEHFQGGPIYIYNNITRNCVGNRALGRELGYSLYLDGAFKCYSFNNIIAGRVDPERSGYYNNCGYFMVFGFMDQLFNNTIYHFEFGLDGSSGNRSNILGNLMLDCSRTFIGQNRPGDVSMAGGGDTGAMGRLGIPTMAYASNVFFGNPTGNKGQNDAFGYVGGISGGNAGGEAPVLTGNTLEELRGKLVAQNCRLATIGWMAQEMPLTDPAKRDYRPTATSQAKGRGVKYFVPWALGRTVGEWNFYKSTWAPQIVLGENFYMTDEYVNRDMYYFLPRNDLVVSQCAATDYQGGELEDWIEGALSFDGRRTASISQAELTKNIVYGGRGAGPANTLDGSKRQTLDMDTNNFLIEAVFRTDPGHINSVLVSKGGNSGYSLGVDNDGKPILTLKANGTAVTAVGNARVNDGAWHHVLAEVDRAGSRMVIYVDGKPAGEGMIQGIGRDASLANRDDFVVGARLVGGIDFLRVCRSTLRESKTSIAELYAWEFDGPALRDFCGGKPAGRRDAGAIDIAR